MLQPTQPWIGAVAIPVGLICGFFYLHRAGKFWAGLLPGFLVWGLASLLQVFPIPVLSTFDVAHWLKVLGNFGLAVALYRLEGNQPPRQGLWLLLPFVVFVVWSVIGGGERWLWMAYSISGLVLIYSLAGHAERYLKGQSPDERVAWMVGLLVFLSGSLWQLSSPAEGFKEQPLWGVLSGLGLWMLGWGALLETVESRKRIWAEGTALAVLMVNWLAALVSVGGNLVASSVATGGWLFMVSLGIVYSHHTRRKLSETRTQDWVKLLENLYHVTPVNQTISPNVVLKEIVESLKPLFPTLVGLALHGDQSTIVGKKTIHDHVIELGEGGDVTLWLYFERRPVMLSELAMIEPLIVKRLRQILVVRELRSQVFTDPLTGLLNRRGMEQQLPRLIEGAQRNRQPIAVAMLDMDHFKRINDTYGHPVGDVALRTMAEVLRSHLRAGDIAVRWGGEEFALILYGAQLADAQAVLDRVQSEMRSRKVATIAWSITLSGGLCGGQVPAGKEELEDWFHQADMALLQAKEAGRNRVEIARLGSGKGRK